MRNVTRCLPLFVLVVAPFMATTTFLSASACPAYNERLTRVLHMPEEPSCKVLLAKDQKSIQVEVKGSHNIYDPYTGKKLDAAFASSSYPMTPTTDGIRWGQEFPGVYQIVVIPDEEATGITVNGVTYAGVVAFYQVDDRLAAVNWVSLDDFTSSLMGSNFLPRDAYQKETIAAYAIALRTLAFQNMMTSESPFFDIKADECGYQGKSVIRVDYPFVEAMKATKRIIMNGNAQAVVSRKSIEELRQKMPSNDVEALAKDGKDARLILHKYFPEAILNIAERRPSANNSYLK